MFGTSGEEESWEGRERDGGREERGRERKGGKVVSCSILYCPLMAAILLTLTSVAQRSAVIATSILWYRFTFYLHKDTDQGLYNKYIKLQ